MQKIRPTIGVFAGLLNADGNLLVRRRDVDGSIVGTSFKSCWELPGGGVQETEGTPSSYDHLARELVKRVEEEVGIQVRVEPMCGFYATLFKGPQGYDLAMVAGISVSKEPSKGINKWVPTEELNELAKGFVLPDKEKGKDGEGLVSGWGKRMHCLALRALCFSPFEGAKARKTLKEIQENW